MCSWATGQQADQQIEEIIQSRSFKPSTLSNFVQAERQAMRIAHSRACQPREVNRTLKTEANEQSVDLQRMRAVHDPDLEHICGNQMFSKLIIKSARICRYEWFAFNPTLYSIIVAQNRCRCVYMCFVIQYLRKNVSVMPIWRRNPAYSIMLVLCYF